MEYGVWSTKVLRIKAQSKVYAFKDITRKTNRKKIAQEEEQFFNT